MAKQPDRKSGDGAAPIPYLALALACAIPGAGHVYLGRVARGIVIFVTVSALFWSGVAIGGVMTLDAKREKWWFVAEMLTGVHGVIGWYRQKHVFEDLIKYDQVQGRYVNLSEPERTRRINLEVDRRAHEAGIALVTPADTAARAYAGVAGLLNLMCIFDALMLSVMGVRGEPPPGEQPKRREPEATPS